MPSSQDKRSSRAASPLATDLDAGPSLAGVVAAGVEAYDRTRHLPRLLPLPAAELADHSAPARRRIVARLARALRAERNRGRAGHWTYDLNRHIALSQAYAAERQALEPGARGTRPPRPVAAARPKREPPPARRRRLEALWEALLSGGGAAGRDPSSSPAPSGRPRSSARPSDSRRPGPISRGNPRAKDRSGS